MPVGSDETFSNLGTLFAARRKRALAALAALADEQFEAVSVASILRWLMMQWGKGSFVHVDSTCSTTFERLDGGRVMHMWRFDVVGDVEILQHASKDVPLSRGIWIDAATLVITVVVRVVEVQGAVDSQYERQMFQWVGYVLRVLSIVTTEKREVELDLRPLLEQRQQAVVARRLRARS